MLNRLLTPYCWWWFCSLKPTHTMYTWCFLWVLKCEDVTFAVGPMVGPLLTLLPDGSKEWQRIPTTKHPPDISWNNKQIACFWWDNSQNISSAQWSLDFLPKTILEARTIFWTLLSSYFRLKHCHRQNFTDHHHMRKSPCISFDESKPKKAQYT